MDAEWKKQLEEHRKRMKELSRIVMESGGGDPELISKMKQLAKQSESVQDEDAKRKTAVQNVTKRIDKKTRNWKEIDINRIYQEEQQKVEENPPPSSNYAEEFNVFMSESAQDSEGSFVISQPSNEPINDPWTLKPIQHRVKSKNCGHYYEKASVMAFTKSKREVRCPYVGCQKMLRAGDFEDD